MPLNNPALAAEINTGTYTGNGAANRATPHGLTGTPKLVIINEIGAATHPTYMGFLIDNLQTDLSGNKQATTGWTSTNFYVTDGATVLFNSNTVNYSWVAIR